MDSYILGQLTMLGFVVVIWAVFSISGRMARRDQRQDMHDTIRTYRDFCDSDSAHRLRQRLQNENKRS